jgi:pimeloyl-ACP methyl ester carboxylesterase
MPVMVAGRYKWRDGHLPRNCERDIRYPRTYKQKTDYAGIGGSGEHSMGIDPVEQFQRLAQTVRGGVITGSGHWVIEEQPDKILAELMEFLS